MAIYSNLPVYKDAYSLLLTVSRQSPNIPKDSRYTLVQDLKRCLMDILVMIYEANSTFDKEVVISKMRRKIVEAQVYLRLLVDMRQVSEGWYATAAAQSASVSKQLAAWQKSSHDRQSQQ